MRSKILVFVSCSLELLLVFGAPALVSVGFAQGPVSVALPAVAPAIPEEPSGTCLKAICRDAPLREKLSLIPLGTPHIRAVIGGFEQGAGLAGGVQFTSADVFRPVEFRATAITSMRFYRRLDLEAYFPRLGDSRNHADVWFSHKYRESNFFGIGPESARDAKSKFSLEERSYQASIYRDFAKRLHGGVYGQFRNARASNAKSTTEPSLDENFSGSPDQVLPWIPGLLSNTKIMSYGAFVEYDSRDGSRGLVRGMDLYARAASDDGMRNHGAFSDYGWNEAEFDLRGYLPLGSPGTSLALRSKGLFKTPKGGSQIPFYELSWLGGREFVRGYEQYRYRANNALILSSELRHTLYAKSEKKGVDVIAFGDSGQVWGDVRSHDPLLRDQEGFGSGRWRTGVGGGVQYRHSQTLGARIELGRSSEGTRVYFSMSRGF